MCRHSSKFLRSRGGVSRQNVSKTKHFHFVTFVKSNAKALSTAELSKDAVAPYGVVADKDFPTRSILIRGVLPLRFAKRSPLLNTL